MTDQLIILVIMGLAVGGLSTTIAKAHIFDKPRDWFVRHIPILGEMLNCPYCVSHWVALSVALLMPLSIMGNHYGDLFLQVFALVSLGAFTTGAIMRLLLWHEAELDGMRAQLDEAREALRELTRE